MEVLIFINVKFCRYYDTRLNGIMKILIEGPSIIAMNRQKPFIRRGYIYIDRGVTVAYNEGAPPPEFEFAEYVVNEKFAVALPGFAVGIGNILEYLFQFDINSKNLANSLSKLSRSELEALIEVVLASLTCSGVTSVISLITNLEEKIVSSLAIAASDAWTRLRILLPLSLLGSLQELESIVKSVARSVKDSEALSRGIVSLGLFIGNEGELNKFSSEWIDTINKAGIYAYVPTEIYRRRYKELANAKNIVLLDPEEPTVPCLYTMPALWKPPCGFISSDISLLNPRKLLPILHNIENGDIYTPIYILSHFNPLNNKIGMHSINEGMRTDIVIISFKEPPYGPIPISEYSILKALSNAFYNVKTVLIDGEVVVDNSLHLNVGEEKVRKVRALIEEIKSQSNCC
jgi:hypothetical protein